MTILANQTSATFDVTPGASNGGALVTATGAGVGSASAAASNGSRLVEWNVDASGAWETPGNWTDNAVPGPGDVVVIDRPAGNFFITISAPTAAVSALNAREHLNIFSTLTIDGAGAIDGGATLAATLNGLGSVAVGSPVSWMGGTVSLGGGLRVRPGQTLTLPANGATRVLSATSLRNFGTVDMSAGNNPILLQGATTVAIVNEPGASGRSMTPTSPPTAPATSPSPTPARSARRRAAIRSISPATSPTATPAPSRS